MSYEVFYTPRAARELRHLVASMTDGHRRETLERELADALARLAASPWIAPPYLPLAHRGVRRALLTRSRMHVYHRVDDGPRRVVVLAIWHSARRDPRL